ncbi:MAG: methyltransferase domain-containing protein [Planctomycetes bacterium]|nr:methyltransferase domain-containing protein [Planctomycetota bacterium]
MAEEYDSLIRRAVPRYDEMMERLMDYLPPRAASILELGCGTGNLTLRIAKKYPEARLVLVDAAPEMLALTEARLAPRRATFVAARFEDVDFEPESFDLIISSISLHHVRDKASLYRVLRRLLRTNGTLRFADQLRGGTEANHALNWERWLEFCRLPGNCTRAEVRSLLDHAAAHDHYTPLAEHFRLLEQAGFANVDCVWRNWIWGVITAEAPMA